MTLSEKATIREAFSLTVEGGGLPPPRKCEVQNLRNKLHCRVRATFRNLSIRVQNILFGGMGGQLPVDIFDFRGLLW